MLDKIILEELREYIDAQLNSLNMKVYSLSECSFSELIPSELENYITNNRKPTLKKVLFSFIDHKGLTDAEVYKKASIDRKHFSKIRSNPDYRPKKNTIVALALALELNSEDAEQLLNSAGYSLSESETYDLVIQFCIEKKIYNLDDVNQALDYFSLKPLNGVL